MTRPTSGQAAAQGAARNRRRPCVELKRDRVEWTVQYPHLRESPSYRKVESLERGQIILELRLDDKIRPTKSKPLDPSYDPSRLELLYSRPLRRKRSICPVNFGQHLPWVQRQISTRRCTSSGSQSHASCSALNNPPAKQDPTSKVYHLSPSSQSDPHRMNASALFLPLHPLTTASKSLVPPGN